jgi:hypothetical protein
VTGFSVVFSVLFLVALVHYATGVIYTSLFMVNALLWTFAALSLVANQVFWGVMMGVFALMDLAYIFVIKRRIALTAALLGWVASTIRRFYTLIAVSVVMSFVSLGLGVACLWAFMASARVVPAKSGAFTDDEKSKVAGLFLFALFNLYWLSEVVKNVLHVTVSGTVGLFYYQGESTPLYVVPKALRRALTTSFGSICFGSLLVAVVQTLRYIAQAARANGDNNSGQQLLACCCSCLLSCLDAALQFFNRYAFVEVSLRGKPFVEAAKDAWELITSNQGVGLLINDNISGAVVFVATLAASFLATLVAWGAGKAVGLGQSDLVALALVAFCATLLIVSTIISTVDSGMAALFVLYATDPAVIHDNHPALSHEIQRRRQESYDEPI